MTVMLYTFYQVAWVHIFDEVCRLFFSVSIVHKVYNSTKNEERRSGNKAARFMDHRV